MFVIAGVWNHLMRIPIPLAKNRVNKLFKAEINIIVIADLEYKIDLSLLLVIELDNKR